MNLQSILQGSIEIILSLITGLLIFFGSFKIFTILTKNIDEIDQLKKNNLAVAILVASFVFGVMLLVKTSIGPAVDALKTVIQSSASVSAILMVILRILIVYIAAAIFAFIVIWLSMKLFMLMTTNIDEMEEIGKNNYSIALVLTTLIASISLVLAEPLKTMLQSVVPSALQTTGAPLIAWPVALAGLYQLAISFFAVIIILFISFKAFDMLTKKIDETAELKSNNFAVSILLSAFIFSMMILIQSSIVPANSTLLLALQQKAGATGIFIALGKVLSFFVIAAIFAFIMLWIAMKFFMLLTTTIDEMAEIKNKKAAVSIVIAVLLISTALLVSHGLPVLLDGIFPTPKVLTNVIKP